MKFKKNAGEFESVTKDCVISIYRIEDSNLVSIEFFPKGQTDDSFQNAEFNNIVDIDKFLNSFRGELYAYPYATSGIEDITKEIQEYIKAALKIEQVGD